LNGEGKAVLLTPGRPGDQPYTISDLIHRSAELFWPVFAANAVVLFPILFAARPTMDDIGSAVYGNFDTGVGRPLEEALDLLVDLRP